MTEKRFFKRDWEESYYIFDSQAISEKEFDEKVEYEDYQAFADSMQGDEVVELLNELHEENQHFEYDNKRMVKFIMSKGYGLKEMTGLDKYQELKE